MVIGVASARVGCPSFMFFFLKNNVESDASYCVVLCRLGSCFLTAFTGASYFVFSTLAGVSSKIIVRDGKILVHQISCLTREMKSAKTFPDPRWPPLYNVTTPCVRHVHGKRIAALNVPHR